VWKTVLYQPLLNALFFFYFLLGNNFGLAIIGLTVVVRLALLSVTRKSLTNAKKIKKLQPKLNKLKEKYKDDKQAYAQAQLELFKKNNVNPAAGCLPQIVQFVILIALYQAFNQVLRANGNIIENLKPFLYSPLKTKLPTQLNLDFLYLKLTEPDVIKLPFTINLGVIKISQLPGLFLIFAAITQFLSSKMLLKNQTALMNQAKKTPGKQDDVAVSMQTQMVYFFPLMTLIIGLNFPSGLVLYWLTFSLLMLVSQLIFKKNK